MDTNVCVHEEYSCDTSEHNHNSIPEVEFRPMGQDEFYLACALYWEFEIAATGEDLSEEVILSDGTLMTKVEKVMNWHLCSNRKVQLAFAHGKPIAILVYHQEVSPLIFIRAFYVQPEFRGTKVGMKLLHSINNKPAKILFQTEAKRPPFELLKHTEKERELLHEDENHKTWMVDFKEIANV